MTDIDHLTERQQIASEFLAFVDRKRLSEVRRDALRSHADAALTDPNIAAAVLGCLRYRREHGVGRPVTKLVALRGGGQ